jgi:hypothetical protein
VREVELSFFIISLHISLHILVHQLGFKNYAKWLTQGEQIKSTLI